MFRRSRSTWHGGESDGGQGLPNMGGGESEQGHDLPDIEVVLKVNIDLTWRGEWGRTRSTCRGAKSEGGQGLPDVEGWVREDKVYLTWRGYRWRSRSTWRGGESEGELRASMGGRKGRGWSWDNQQPSCPSGTRYLFKFRYYYVKANLHRGLKVICRYSNFVPTGKKSLWASAFVVINQNNKNIGHAYTLHNTGCSENNYCDDRYQMQNIFPTFE